MKLTNISVILVLALATMLLPLSQAHGAQYLTVNGQDVNELTLELGESYSVQVASTDGASYVAHVGFDTGVVSGDFLHIETTPQAGNFAAIADFSQGAFHGFYLNAAGFSPSPSAGTHFVFQYQPEQTGETRIKLYDQTFSVLIDQVRITRIPLTMGNTFAYQGTLADSSDPADGLYDLEFALYDTLTGGAPIATPLTFNEVDIIDGHFAVDLNFDEPNTFDGNARWIEIAVRQGELVDPSEYTILSPRQRIMPAPYALYAKTTAPPNDWAVSGTDMYSLPTGNIGIGTTTPIARLEVMETESGHGIWSTAPGIPVYAHRTSTNGTWPAVHGECDSLSSYASAVRGEISSTSPGSGSAAVRGINNGQNNKGTGVWGSHDGSGSGVYGSASGVTGRGVYGLSGGDQGHGVYGKAVGSVAHGIHGEATGSSGKAVYGKATGGSGAAGYFIATGDYSNGVTAFAHGENSKAVYGHASNHGDEDNYGGYFWSEGTYGIGLYGYASGTGGTGVRGWGRRYDFYAAGPGGNYQAASSLRWKSDIIPIDNPLEKLLRLRGVYYTWDAEHGGHEDMGMIAEEVGQVLPEIVSYEENGIDATGMDYSKLTPLLVEAVKALKIEMDELRRQQESKDGRIRDLQEELTQLKNTIVESPQLKSHTLAQTVEK